MLSGIRRLEGARGIMLPVDFVACYRYSGKSYLCSKCKTLLAIIDRSTVPQKYTVVPI